MARFINNNTINSNESGELKQFSLGSTGNSMVLSGTVKIQAPCLQKYTLENGLRKYGEVITGEECQRILTAWVIQDKDMKLARFKKLVDSKMIDRDFVGKIRTYNSDDMKLKDRAKLYIVGACVGALNTIPSRIVVNGENYQYHKITQIVEYDPFELRDVISGSRSLGNGESIQPLDSDGSLRRNMNILPPDLLQEAIDYFVTTLRVRLEGNVLKILDKEAVTFVASGIDVVLDNVDITDINIDDIEINI